MKVSIFSREAIKGRIISDFPKNTAVISFYDPNGLEPVDYQGKAARLFQVALHDIDLLVLPEFGLNYNTYFPEVKELAGFIAQAKADGLDIICQCEYGQSRSAGCAAAILEFYEHKGLSIFTDYRYYPNQLVYHKVYDELKHLGH